MIDQGELFDIPNPCRGICEVNNKGFCKGCLRSRQERFHWQEMSPFQKQLVVNLCNKRRLKLLEAKQRSTSKEEPDLQGSPQADMFSNPTNRSQTEQVDPSSDQSTNKLKASDKASQQDVGHEKANEKRLPATDHLVKVIEKTPVLPESGRSPHHLADQAPKQQFGLFD